MKSAANKKPQANQKKIFAATTLKSGLAAAFSICKAGDLIDYDEAGKIFDTQSLLRHLYFQ